MRGENLSSIEELQDECLFEILRRLPSVCTGLQSRLQEYKSENQQLEELLTSERELSKSYEAHIKQLQQDLSAAKNEATRIESSMAEALMAKNSGIEALLKSVDSLKTQLALSERNLASLQVQDIFSNYIHMNFAQCEVIGLQSLIFLQNFGNHE